MRRKRRQLHLNGNSYVCSCALLSLQHTIHNWIIIEEQTNVECSECARGRGAWNTESNGQHLLCRSYGHTLHQFGSDIAYGDLQKRCRTPKFKHPLFSQRNVNACNFNWRFKSFVVCTQCLVVVAHYPLLLLLWLVRIVMQCAKKIGDWLRI